ncbi:MAG: peptide chain release factor 2 [Candidatus Omnitrophica bacterium CG1_02_44_16]|nr:MAG: peptide chain release factor 2 [Candidatus Omnitrophica bacterium CG1_02_44_16]
MTGYGGIFDIDNKDNQIASLQAAMAQEGFWQDLSAANVVVQKIKSLKNVSEPWHKQGQRVKEIEEFFHISEGEGEDFLTHLNSDLDLLVNELKRLEFYTLMGGEFDKNDAILNINAGAGGTESCDWASMLLRMYTRWAQARGYDVAITDILPGEEAGTKNVTVIIKGEYAFGYLRSEAGVHRLVRISPFDANKRRHTSFASVDVISVVPEDVPIEIKPDDIRMDLFRAGGKGGQHVNTTDSAVRITHIPTGIVVQCQNERSQHQNKDVAMNILKSRLYEAKRRQQEEKSSREYDKKQKIEWGSQIRSYVLHPYSMVKDHRTDYETGDPAGVLDGKIDDLIEAYLRMSQKHI